MTNWLRPYWEARSPRERLLIGIMAAVAGAILLWLLILRPVAGAGSAAAETREAAAESLGATRSYAREIARLKEGGSAEPASASALAASAAAAGLRAAVAEEREGALRLAFESARPQAFFGWVGAVEGRGLPVQRLSAVPNGAGSLRAEVVFRRPRR